jgi:hypothetical protein
MYECRLGSVRRRLHWPGGEERQREARAAVDRYELISCGGIVVLATFRSEVSCKDPFWQAHRDGVGSYSTAAARLESFESGSGI